MSLFKIKYWDNGHVVVIKYIEIGTVYSNWLHEDEHRK